MPALSVNCYTIQGVDCSTDKIPLSEGIRLTQDEDRGVIHLGDCCTVSIAHRSSERPECNATHLLRAQMTRDDVPGRRPRLVASPAESRSIILHVVSGGLRFAYPPIADKLNLWPGGDGDILPFRQYGEHKNYRDKQQLFQLEEGAEILVIDELLAIARITCIGGGPRVFHPGVKEVAGYLLKRAHAQSKVQAIDWALHNLLALSKAHVGETIVLNAIDELNRLRASK